MIHVGVFKGALSEIVILYCTVLLRCKKRTIIFWRHPKKCPLPLIVKQTDAKYSQLSFTSASEIRRHFQLCWKFQHYYTIKSVLLHVTLEVFAVYYYSYIKRWLYTLPYPTSHILAHVGSSQPYSRLDICSALVRDSYGTNDFCVCVCGGAMPKWVLIFWASTRIVETHNGLTTLP